LAHIVTAGAIESDCEGDDIDFRKFNTSRIRYVAYDGVPAQAGEGACLLLLPRRREDSVTGGVPTGGHALANVTTAYD
jgi:hypothetical protein